MRLQEELTAPPAVAGNRLFIGGKQGVLYCLDAGNGRPFWDFDAGSEILSTPSLLGDRVYVGTGGETSTLWIWQAGKYGGAGWGTP